MYAGYMCKRLRGRYPELKIVAGLWHELEDSGSVSRELLPAAAVDGVATSLGVSGGAEWSH